VNGNHPFSIVEEEDFKKMIVNLNQSVSIPCRMTIQREITQSFTEYKSKLVSLLEANDSKIAITTDIWTSMSSIPYAAITAHFIGSNRKLSRVLLDFCHIPYPHSGEQVKNLLLNTFEDFNIMSKIISVTTDNATNNIKGLNLLNEYLEENLEIENICHFPCFGHILNLSINDGIKCFATIITNLRQIGSVLKNSSKKLQSYQNTCKAINQEFIKLKRDTYIRWNSTYDMIDRGLKMKKVIQIVCLNDDELNSYYISDDQWRELEIIHKFLRNFYEATTLLSAQNYSSICIVIPILDCLLDHCKSYSENEILKDCINLIETKLKKYEPRLKNIFSYFAVILDPRLNFEHLKSIVSKSEHEKVRDVFIGKFNENYALNVVERKTTEISVVNTPSLLSSIYKKRKLNENEELESYENLPQESPQTDPIEWWKMHENIYPTLSKLAFGILCIPATSVPSEHIFSKAGDIVTKKRSRLSDSSLQSLMCLNTFYNLFDQNECI
jgi:hypothetical protein